MFGEDLSPKTIEHISILLKMDIDNVMRSNTDTLRFNIEELYDIAEENVMSSAMNGDSLKPEIDRFNQIKDTYSLIMNDIESNLNRML